MDENERAEIDWPALKAKIKQDMEEWEGPISGSPLPSMSDHMPGWREWNWYRGSRRGYPPGLHAPDFAEAYRVEPSAQNSSSDEQAE